MEDFKIYSRACGIKIIRVETERDTCGRANKIAKRFAWTGYRKGKNEKISVMFFKQKRIHACRNRASVFFSTTKHDLKRDYGKY